jgi:peptidoglycan hydrolase CwlO-like protein
MIRKAGSPSEDKNKKITPWWIGALGALVAVAISGVSLAASYGGDKARMSVLQESVARVENKADSAASVAQEAQRELASKDAVIATIQTKVDNIQEDIKEIKETQKKILDLLIKRGGN